MIMSFNGVWHHESEGKSAEEVEENYEHLRKLILIEGLPEEKEVCCYCIMIYDMICCKSWIGWAEWSGEVIASSCMEVSIACT